MTTGGTHLKTDSKIDAQKKERLAKIAVGAASVMVGTGLYAGHAANVKADANENPSSKGRIEQQDTTQSTGIRATAAQNTIKQSGENTQPSNNQATGQGNQNTVAANQSSQNQSSMTTPTTSNQQEGQEIDSNNYKVDELDVIANNGINADTHGHITLTTRLRFPDASKINNGDYIDFKLGAPTADGKFVDYSSSLLPNQDVMLTNQYGEKVKVGQIQQMDAGTNTAYYRLVFNDQLRTFISPIINLQLIWKSMIQSGVMLRLYTQKAGYPDNVTLMNDLQVGNDITTSWTVQVPVIYVPSTGKTQQDYNLIQAGYGAEHIWTIDSNGNEKLQVYGMNETVNVWLADKLSNKFTVTVQGLADNPYFETEYSTGDQVATQIENAIKQQHRTISLGDKVAKQTTDLSFGVVANDDGSQIPNVTVTRIQGKTANGYDTMIYHITIDSDQPVSIGNTPIVFGTIQNKQGIVPNAASTIKTFNYDQNSIASSKQEFDYGGGYSFAGTYRGPELANQDLQHFMSTRNAAYVTIHDDENSSNNNGHLSNVPYYNTLDPQADLAPVHFVFNIAQQNTVSGDAANNASSGIGMQAGTKTVTEQKTVTETIHYQLADGNATGVKVPSDNVQKATFTRQGTWQKLDNTTTWGDWTLTDGGWNDVKSPDIPGYTPSQAMVAGVPNLTADTNDSKVTVIYTKNIEIGHVSLNFVDADDNNRVLISKQFNGEVDSDTNYNTVADLQTLKKDNYVLNGEDPTDGKNVKISDTQQTITISLKHDKKDTQNSKTITETIHYQYTDGSQAAPDYKAIAHFTRTGQHDEVTGVDTWNPWTSNDNNFTAVDSPVLTGYTPSQTSVAGKNVGVNDPDTEITIIYTKNSVPVKNGKIIVNYVDTDAGNRVLLSKQFSGQVGTDSNYNTNDDIQALQKEHYELAEDDPTGGKNITISDGNQTVTIKMKHHHETITENKVVTETIHYKYANGDQVNPDHTATANFSRTGIKDDVTGNQTWNNWTSNDNNFAAVDTPELAGYTASQKSVTEKTVNANDPNTEITVIYTKNSVPVKNGQIIVNYVDTDEGNRVLLSRNLSGAVGTNADYTAKEDLTNLTNAHYQLASDLPKGNLTFPGDPQTVTVSLKHALQPVNDSKTVTETIHYRYTDGSQAAPDHKATANFTRTGQHDAVTGSDKWNSWTSNDNNFAAVDSPVLTGYTPSQATVAGKTVAATDPNTDITVVYSKQAVPVKTGTVMIKFIDSDDNNRVLLSKQFSGQIGVDTHYDTKDDLTNLTNSHYVVGNDETHGQTVKITADQGTYNVYLKHGSKTVKDTKDITETIHYQYVDGTPAMPDHVTTIHFTRQGVHDEVTGNDTWDPWNADSDSFAAVDSPAINGYTANPETVNARKVNSDSPDQEITVTYLKKTAQDQGNNQPGQQPADDHHAQQPTDHGQTQSANQSVAGQQTNAESSEPVSYQENATGQMAQTSSQVPSGYKWETIRVLVPDSQSSQQRLPQTGNNQRQMGVVVTLLAAILGIFGLSWTGFKKERRHD